MCVCVCAQLCKLMRDCSQTKVLVCSIRAKFGRAVSTLQKYCILIAYFWNLFDFSPSLSISLSLCLTLFRSIDYLNATNCIRLAATVWCSVVYFQIFWIWFVGIRTEWERERNEKKMQFNVWLLINCVQYQPHSCCTLSSSIPTFKK